MRFALLLALCFACRADELDYQRHHQSGMALVHSARYGTFTAAFQTDDFDAGHTPELGLQTLSRIYLVPYKKLPAPVTPEVITSGVEVKPDGAGHATIAWAGWQIEFIPVAAINRKENRTNYESGASLACGEMEFIIKPALDEILIVMRKRL